MESKSEIKPKMFIYSLLLPLIWMLFGLIWSSIFPEKRLGVAGLLIILYATLTPICWHAAKNFKRHFTKPEKFKLILYLSSWAILLELFALWGVADTELSGLTSNQLLGIVGFTVIVDTIFMWLGVIFAGKRIQQFYINKYSVNNA